MPHVITQACCNDSTCVDACPVNCIHPARGEPGHAHAEMLFIDPEVCIDCGACVDVCPVDAIAHHADLRGSAQQFIELNAVHAERFRALGPADPAIADSGPAGGSTGPIAAVSDRPPARTGSDVLRVAIVGSGPAGCYAAEELLTRPGLNAEVHMFERLPTPWGLVRFGVAPDHPDTKKVARQFRRTAARPGFYFHLNVQVGREVTYQELAQHHHAVICAVGAAQDRHLGIPGEDLPGSHAATEFVAWYNGHPDAAGQTFDLSSERAVVIGNGNVALDVARVLLTPVERLATTDIAHHALTALRTSRIREVVLLGRRGPAQAAYTNQELLGLADVPGVAVTADPSNVMLDPATEAELAAAPDPVRQYKVALATALAKAPAPPQSRKVVLRFMASPVELSGVGTVESLRIARNQLVVSPAGRLEPVPTGSQEVIETGLVLRSVGYRGSPQEGLPFDAARGTLPNVRGRVVDLDTAKPVRGLYATGWIKRGPSGVIGTNRDCAAETVTTLVTDYLSGDLVGPSRSRAELERMLDERCPERLDYEGWKAIDVYERNASPGRSRAKLVDIGSMLAVAQNEERP